MNLDKLKPYPLNINYMDKETYDNFKRNIKERMKHNKRWFTKNIEIRVLENGDLSILDGHQKIHVLKELNIKDISNKYITNYGKISEEDAKDILWSNQIRGRINPIAQALFLMDDKKKGLKQREIAKKYNMPRSTVADILRRLKNLSPKIIEDFKNVDVLTISIRAINELMRLKDNVKVQLKIYNVIKKRHIPFSELKGIIDTVMCLSANTQMKLLGRWIDLDIKMDKDMEDDFIYTATYGSYKALGKEADKKERDLWIYEHIPNIIRKLKPEWIYEKKIDKKDYPSINWGKSREQTESEILKNKGVVMPLPKILRSVGED